MDTPQRLNRYSDCVQRGRAPLLALSAAIFCLFSVSFALAESIALSADERAHLDAKGRVSMCIDPDWMPYERIDENGKHIGIAADYMALFQDMIGTPIELIPTKSWDQSTELAKARKCDILSMLNKSEERSKYLNFTPPYLKAAVVLITRDDVVFLDGLSGLAGETLGVVKGYVYEEIIKTRFPSVKVIQTTSLKEALRRVSNGEIKATIASLFIVMRHIQEIGLSNLKIAGQTDFQNEFRVGIRNDDPLLLSALTKAVQSLDPQTENSILQRWYTVRMEHGVDYELLWRASAIAALIVLFLGYRYMTLRRFNARLDFANRELKIRNDALARMAQTDHLTGIFNRIHLDAVLSREVSRSGRYGHPLSLIIIDIDDFKAVNDQHGHLTGDAVLVNVCERISDQIRKADVFGRWGGEEFLIICPDTYRDGAAQQAEKLRDALASTPCSSGVGIVTASFGVADLGPDDNETTLVAKADEALYSAKDSGRNRVTVATD